jgi:hypothetical protein
MGPRHSKRGESLGGEDAEIGGYYWEVGFLGEEFK